MNIGDIVRYAPFPHKELHKSGITGLVISEAYVEKATRGMHLIDVMWGNDRGLSYPAGCVCQEFVNELEVIN